MFSHQLPPPDSEEDRLVSLLSCLHFSESINPVPGIMAFVLRVLSVLCNEIRAMVIIQSIVNIYLLLSTIISPYLVLITNNYTPPRVI